MHAIPATPTTRPSADPVNNARSADPTNKWLSAGSMKNDTSADSICNEGQLIELTPASQR